MSAQTHINAALSNIGSAIKELEAMQGALQPMRISNAEHVLDDLYQSAGRLESLIIAEIPEPAKPEVA